MDGWMGSDGCPLAPQEINMTTQWSLVSTIEREEKMGDEEDFFEWKALIEGIKEWAHTKENLKGLIKL